MLTEQIDTWECESMDQILELLSTIECSQQLTVEHSPVTALLDFHQDLIDHLEVEAALLDQDFRIFRVSLNALQNYKRETNFIYAAIEKYLETRPKDNYRDSLYRDNQQLMQLRQEKLFILQLLILSLTPVNDLMLDTLVLEMRAYASTRFASIRIKTMEILNHAMNLIQELKQPQFKFSRSSSFLRKNSAVDQSQQATEKTVLILLLELQNNQFQCKEILPNLRFIVKNYVRQFRKEDLKRTSKSSLAEFKRQSLGNYKRQGLDLPNLGPMERISHIVLNEEQERQMISVGDQIQDRLNDGLFDTLCNETNDIQGQEIEQRFLTLQNEGRSFEQMFYTKY